MMVLVFLLWSSKKSFCLADHFPCAPWLRMLQKNNDAMYCGHGVLGIWSTRYYWRYSSFLQCYFSMFFGSSSAHLVWFFCRHSFRFHRPSSVGCLLFQKGFYLANHIPYVPWLSTVPRKWSNIGSHGVPGIWSDRYHWCSKGSLLRFLTSVFEDLKWSMWWGMLELHSNWILQRVGELLWDIGCTVTTGCGPLSDCDPVLSSRRSKASFRFEQRFDKVIEGVFIGRFSEKS